MAIIEQDIAENMEREQQEKKLWRFAVSNIALEIIQNNSFKAIHQVINEKICIIIGIDAMEHANDQDDIIATFEQIRELVLKHLNLNISIGIGNIYKDIIDICISYKEADFAIKNKLMLGESKVIDFSTVSEIKFVRNIYDSETRNNLIMNMRIGNVKVVERIIENVFKELKNINMPFDQLFITCIEMISTCIEFLIETGHDFSKFFPNEHNLIEDIKSKRTLEEMRVWVKELIYNAVSFVREKRYNKYQKIVESINKYILENYSEDNLSVNKIAKNMFMNYGYLCCLYKRETGKTINNYITEIRMNKARQLIEQGNHYVLDIANKVGYNNQGYFSRCFKKFYSVSPSQYIQSKE